MIRAAVGIPAVAAIRAAAAVAVAGAA